MKRRLIRRPQVERDLIEIGTFIAQDKLPPAERFLKVAEETMGRLSAMPGMGRTWDSSLPHLSGIRVLPMPSGFRNYLIFYRPIEDGIEVLAIMHGARNLGAALESRMRNVE
jgi:toxin ParE1/3/4